MPLSKEDFRDKSLERIKDSSGFCGKFHQSARDDFAFVAGDQWTPEDKAKMETRKRPVVVFNYSEKMVDAVCGSEVSNRQEATYHSRTMGSDPLAEMMTYAAKWVRDECQAEDEETDAFRDALICGMGWTETKMDYSEDPNGMPIVSRIDPIEMRWDPAAIKPGLSDRRWDAQGVWMDNQLITLRWPDAVAASAGDDTTDGMLQHIQEGNRYRDDDATDEDQNDRRVDQTLVWSMQCVENEPYYRVEDGQGGIQDVDVKLFGKIRKKLDEVGLKYIRSWKRVYYHGFMSGDGLGTVYQFGPLPIQVSFTRQCITGKRDRNQNYWYGLTRVMKDPQRWANKWLSQIMYIINSNAKGGLIAESNALMDIRKAEEDWASSDKIVLLKEGGLNKIKERTMAAYPAGLAQLMEFALNSLPQVTGINLEALGLADRDQANVLEQSRKQAAYGLLAPIFDSLRRYRKNHGKLLYYFIQKFIADGRLIRVIGPGYEQVVPLMRVPDSFQFDVVVDSSPAAPDIKNQTWSALMQLIPSMLKAGMPIPPTLLSYAPIPTQLATQWQQFLAQAQQQGPNPQQLQQQLQQMGEQMQQLQQENMSLKQDNSDKMVKANQEAMESQAKMRREDAMANAEIVRKNRQMQADLLLKGIQIDGDSELQKQQFAADQSRADAAHTHQMQMADKNTTGNLRIKAAQSGVKSDKTGEVRMKVDNSEVVDALKQITGHFHDALGKVVEGMNRPKKVVRSKDGVIIGVE